MSNRIRNLTGMVFGRWTVVSLSHLRTKNGRAYWNCRCECGREYPVIGGNLIHGLSKGCKSCGQKIGQPKRRADMIATGKMSPDK